MKRALFFAVLTGLITAARLGAEEAPQGVDQGPLVIGRIIVDRRNVFDTGTPIDKQFPYSWANAIHIVTKESYIRRELLFREGQPFDPVRIDESERLLRRRPIFRFVSITPQPAQNGVVDIVVKTEDVWTTTVQLGYGTAGGKNFYKVGFLEHNFLGKGRGLGAFIRQDIDRLVKGVAYTDPRFLGSRFELLAGYGKDEKGVARELDLSRPFFSAMSHQSEGVFIDSVDDEDRLFDKGDEVAHFQHATRDVRLFASKAIDPRPERVHRVSVIHQRQEDNFSEVSTPLLMLPDHRVVSAIMAGYEYERMNFVKERGILTFDRIEDINLGLDFLVEAGPSLESLGATRDGAVHREDISKVWKPASNHVFFANVNSFGRYEKQQLTDTLTRLRGQYYILDWWREHTTFLRIDYEAGKNLDPEKQLLLGGENGLRGYSVRQFSGNKKAVVILEDRQVIAVDWLHLVSVGWAAFLDSGNVWKRYEEPSFADFKSDVGLGLRFAPSRSFDPTLIRVDLAYALNENDRRSRFVFNIGGEITFGEREQKKFEQ